VLDGLVYTPAGITLNWHGPAASMGSGKYKDCVPLGDVALAALRA
jgi:hypothetical protein